LGLLGVGSLRSLVKLILLIVDHQQLMLALESARWGSRVSPLPVLFILASGNVIIFAGRKKAKSRLRSTRWPGESRSARLLLARDGGWTALEAMDESVQ
jgi:hypothetical protein